MIRWELVDSAHVPGGGGGELFLYRRGAEYSIRLGNGELMNSRVHGSEDALAELACARIASRTCPHFLIGGLGMGFTLAAALRLLGSGASVAVAELVPSVVQWNRGPLSHLAGHPLDDVRVTVYETDVAQMLKVRGCAYDAVLLDVDNGPEGFTRQRNEWLYTPEGLAASFEALRPGGVLAIWSAGPDSSFTRRLRRAGFDTEEVRVHARGKRSGGHHTIWLAVRRP
ncbi:MAG: MnmC family methyltransferase [Nitrospirota bacterium]